ncbi:cutinase [Colletotrichum orchidophilum]|uniref:Cutinase n=1 Tax=Colletotrichum orchidophilum TaxID=1209926 RepID=A0A1G4BLR3_9PEZI|nr:cutinase [Colletotrichum orchidophilum]OHF02246.1 cutinase [Colletotrichum orchidophilum]
MVSILSAALALLSALPLTSGAPGTPSTSDAHSRRQATGDSNCQSVHIFLARGNNEPYPGRQGKLVAAICDGLSSCDYEDIQFWNPLEAPYCQSIEEGVANGTAQITAYNKRCPDAKLVVSGYSQGAHVVGDVLGGGGGTFFQGCQEKASAGLDATTAPGNKREFHQVSILIHLKIANAQSSTVAAVLVFGDTRHTANQPYNYLSGAPDNGLFPRPENQLAGMRAFSSVMRSYCVDSDPICAGGNTAANHLSYFDVYSSDAGKWVQEMVGKADTTTSSSSTSTIATSTTSAPASSSSSPPSSTSLSASAATPSVSGSAGSSAGGSTTAAPTSPDAASASSPTPTSHNAAKALTWDVASLGATIFALLAVAGLI